MKCTEIQIDGPRRWFYIEKMNKPLFIIHTYIPDIPLLKSFYKTIDETICEVLVCHQINSILLPNHCCLIECKYEILPNKNK